MVFITFHNNVLTEIFITVHSGGKSQVQISKSITRSKSKNVGRDKYLLRVRFDNWAQIIDQREKWVELLVQSALSQVCHVNFVCRFSRNYGQILENPIIGLKKTSKIWRKKVHFKKHFRKIGSSWKSEMTSYGENPTQILHMSFHRNINFANVVIPALMWTA